MDKLNVTSKPVKSTTADTVSLDETLAMSLETRRSESPTSEAHGRIQSQNDELETEQFWEQQLVKKQRRLRILEMKKQCEELQRRADELEGKNAVVSLPPISPPVSLPASTLDEHFDVKKEQLFLNQALPTFAGVDSERIEEFIRHLELFATMSNVKPTAVLYAALKGKAQTWLVNFWSKDEAARYDWNITKKAMEIRFPSSVQLVFFKLVSDPPLNALQGLELFKTAAESENIDIEQPQNKRLLLKMLQHYDNALASTLAAFSIGSGAMTTAEMMDKARYTLQLVGRKSNSTPKNNTGYVKQGKESTVVDSFSETKKCNHCKKTGHVEQDCFIKKREDRLAKKDETATSRPTQQKP